MEIQSITLRRMDDLELVPLARNGDEAAFQELVRRHYDRAYKQALSVLRDEEEAHDEVQNAFLKIWKSLGQFQGNSKFSTWMSRIVVNQCLMRLRQLRRARLVYIEDTAEGEDRTRLDLPDPAASPERTTGERQVADVLRTEIRRIPALLRDVFVRHYLEGKPLQEVADEMGLTLGATKSRLLRARAELKSRLAKHCGPMGAATLLG
jgi:RNA polymerase sigma-70 factor (ECF subfamily)